MKRILLLTTTMLFLPLLLAAGEIWVAPHGDDRADGTREHPLRTPQAALQRAREWRRTADPRIEGGIDLLFEAGIYHLEEPLFIRPEDSGTAASPTRFRSADPARPAVWSGGVELADWTREGELWVAEAPRTQQRPLLTRQLWSADALLPRAQLFEEGTLARMIDFDPENCSITIPRPAVEGLDRAPQLEMLVHQRWAIALLRVRELRYEGDRAVVRFLEPESRLEFTHPWPQPVIGGERGNSSFTLLNARELLDRPGEWWQDYATGRIYYRPAAGERTAPRLTVPRLRRLVTVAGTARRPVQHLRFEGIVFRHAAWDRPIYKGHVTLQGGFPLLDAYKLHEKPGFAWDPNLENQAWVERPDAAVEVRFAERIAFDGCRFEQLGATGLDYAAGVRDAAVERCSFRGIGGSAILVGPFGEGASEQHIPYPLTGGEEALCEEIRLFGNDIADATQEDWGAVGIGAGYVRDTEIAGNSVARVNYSGIAVGWGWTSRDTGMRNNRIVGNTVLDYARQLYDAGGIYTLSNQPGSVIEANVIGLPGPAPYATNGRGFCIYLDAMTDGYTIRNNYCPEARFGTNNPGPAIVWGANGPEIDRQALRARIRRMKEKRQL